LDEEETKQLEKVIASKLYHNKSKEGGVIQIIPNWHPILVHFTIALYTTSAAVYIFTAITQRFLTNNLVLDLYTTARWCLWIAAFSTFFTIAAGFYAFNTVQHNEVSHRIMSIHRNWGLTTAIGICLLAGISIWRYYKNKNYPSFIFLGGLILVGTALLITGYLGGELVYRYGLGVISPSNSITTHHH
jgi:uncharacterized membrane protein